MSQTWLDQALKPAGGWESAPRRPYKITSNSCQACAKGKSSFHPPDQSGEQDQGVAFAHANHVGRLTTQLHPDTSSFSGQEKKVDEDHATSLPTS